VQQFRPINLITTKHKERLQAVASMSPSGGGRQHQRQHQYLNEHYLLLHAIVNSSTEADAGQAAAVFLKETIQHPQPNTELRGPPGSSWPATRNLILAFALYRCAYNIYITDA
jgi:CubicO group peptidase (beta-lactamase class C family)